VTLLTEALVVDEDDPELEKKISQGLEELGDRSQEFLLASKKESSGMSEDLKKELRRRCKTDLFFLAYSILGYDRLSPVLHGQICAWLEKNNTERYIELLLPRAHFKSTIETISHTIQNVLPDDVGDQPHPYNLGTDARILIVHEVSRMASGYLFSIIQHFMSNPVLMALFPECVPTPKKHKINATELVLPRTKIWNEPTIGAMGVGGRSQGLHYDKLVLDDIIGEKARDSETEAANTKLWFDGIPGFFTSYRQAKFTVVGTRWGPDDIYEHIAERYEGQLKIYRRSIEEPDGDKKGIDGKPKLVTIFPEEVGEEDLRVLKKNPIVYASQYMNDPEGGNTKFNPDWVRKAEKIDATDMIRFPKTEIHLKKSVHISDLSVCVLWDPALTGLTGYCVVGTDYAKRHTVLEAKQESLSAPEAIERFFELYAKYQFRTLAIEEVLFSELYRHWLETEFKLRGIRFNVFPVKLPKGAAAEKGLRVLGLAPLLSSGNLYLLDDKKTYTWDQDRTKKYSDLEFQIRKFGAITVYHTLDALANLEQVAMAGYDASWSNNLRKQEEERLKKRSRLGYSEIKYGRSGY
jgi:hypothetical protein